MQLRLRVERQLGFKMAKYIMRIELVDRLDHIGGGYGSYWEDRGYDWYAGMRSHAKIVGSAMEEMTAVLSEVRPVMAERGRRQTDDHHRFV